MLLHSIEGLLMKISFVDAEWPGFGHRTQRWAHKNMHGDINPPPLYQMIAAAAAKKTHNEVFLWDAPAQRVTNKEIINEINELSTDMVVVNTSTPSFDHDISFIRLLRASNYKGKILVVGPHVTVYWKEVLNTYPEIDWVGLGEYDFLPRDLCDHELTPEYIQGIAYRNNSGEIVRSINQSMINMDDLPWADYSLVSVNNYNEFLFPIRQRPIATVMTSRGCPYHCSFCLYPQVLFGHKLRFRSIENVIEELHYLKKNYGIRFFYFEDDTFTVDWKRVQKLSEAMLETNLNTYWGCLGRVNGVTTENLNLMKKAGCYLIKYGVETGTQDQLNSIQKNLSIEEIEHAFRLTHEAKILSHATVMFGYPGDTHRIIQRTHSFLRKLKPDFVQFSICTPFPGTSLFTYCENNKLLQYEKWEDFDGAWGGVIETHTLTRKQVREFVASSYKIYYFTIFYLMRRIYRSIAGPDVLSQWLQNIDLMKRFLRRYVFNANFSASKTKSSRKN